ncbi:hypothetical protein LAZ67_1005714 [Cordylochernes scorpioides]|uniref:Uncharacterized protein n=1 Tax=Cordylochernes scorpioides TaxID=51811 RepID=A0ABY6JZ50_9ARAC|nr:hypothetical protein LAZ67_1005714 [Cordylochernes scorpioides]
MSKKANSDILIFKIYVEEFNTYANQFDEICQQRNIRRVKLYHENIAELFKTIKETYYQIVRSNALEASETLIKEYIDVKNRYENFVFQIGEILEVEDVSQPVKLEQNVISNVKLPKFNLPVFSGPKLQNNIFNILLKFCTNSVALVADIEKMYRQIRLHPDDIRYQTILWRDCKDLELQEYSLLTVTYGLACAPYLAIRTLHQIAHEVQVSNPRVSKIIREDFYVDDLLTGCPTVEDAKGLVQQLIAVLGSGGFVLRKWVSNETSIIEDLPLLLRGKGRPFEKIGIDLAGPIQAKPMLKRSKVIFKFYIVLFVCFTTKAIHLEISSDLTAETFLAALKRFISRRGRPTDIYSDNATNFKGASNILKERWKLFNAANIQEFSAIESINWHFIPPSALNFGGLWEAGIKSVKTILSKTMKSRLLNYEELLTLLAQIEACLNSRPLTFVSNDPNDLGALTPGHFLIGNAILHDAESDHSTLNLRSRWNLIQPQRDFWNRWSCEYLHQLQERRKWRTSHPDVNIGDLVMLKEQNKPLQWKLARIVQIFPGEDDHVRVVLLRMVLTIYSLPNNNTRGNNFNSLARVNSYKPPSTRKSFYNKIDEGIEEKISHKTNIGLFADDIILWSSNTNWKKAERDLNKTLLHLEKFANKHKLEFNPQKSETCLFTTDKKLYKIRPKIILKEQQLQYNKHPKYLGYTLDPEINSSKHIEEVIRKGRDRLKILKYISGREWGADATTLKLTYTSLIRPILEYGYQIYGTASETNLKSLERIQLSAARIITGLRNTCPNDIVLYEADIMPLKDRRSYNLPKYINKIKSYGNKHRTSNYILNWESNLRLKKEGPLHLAKRNGFLKYKVEKNYLAEKISPCEPLQNVIFNASLNEPTNKQCQNPEYLKQLSLETINNIPKNAITIYTDGSRDELGHTGSGCLIKTTNGIEKMKRRNPDFCSVFRSELIAIYEALKSIRNTNYQDIWILTDSRSAIQHLSHTGELRDKVSRNIIGYLQKLSKTSKIHLQWIPSHVGIEGNEAADVLAKKGTKEPLPQKNKITFKEIETVAKTKINKNWRIPPKHSWYSGVNPGGALNIRNRQHQTTLTRFRTGHLKPLKIENNNKIYPTCPKCSLAPAAPEHILACIRCTKQDLWERPLLIIKQLEEHELMEFV